MRRCICIRHPPVNSGSEAAVQDGGLVAFAAGPASARRQPATRRGRRNHYPRGGGARLPPLADTGAGRSLRRARTARQRGGQDVDSAHQPRLHVRVDPLCGGLHGAADPSADAPCRGILRLAPQGRARRLTVLCPARWRRRRHGQLCPVPQAVAGSVGCIRTDAHRPRQRPPAAWAAMRSSTSSAAACCSRRSGSRTACCTPWARTAATSTATARAATTKTTEVRVRHGTGSLGPCGLLLRLCQAPGRGDGRQSGTMHLYLVRACGMLRACGPMLRVLRPPPRRRSLCRPRTPKQAPPHCCGFRVTGVCVWTVSCPEP
eukprot:535249-Prymnesium_polylepis.1